MDAVGGDVGELHQRLVEAGEQIDVGELHSAAFGKSTLIAVKDFQARHVDPRGRGLTVDGVVGPATWAALANPREPVEKFIADGWRQEPSLANHEAMHAVMAAVAEIGQKEIPPGSNRGPRIDLYNGPDYVGSPWCAALVSWAWSRTPGGSPFGKKTSALKLYSWAKTNGKLLEAGAFLLPGDVGVLLRSGGRGHTEIVCAREFEGKVSFVGGNVANACRGTLRARDAFEYYFRPVA